MHFISLLQKLQVNTFQFSQTTGTGEKKCWVYRLSKGSICSCSFFLPFFGVFNLMLEISSPEAGGQFSLHLILPMITGFGCYLHLFIIIQTFLLHDVDGKSQGWNPCWVVNKSKFTVTVRLKSSVLF